MAKVPVVGLETTLGRRVGWRQRGILIVLFLAVWASVALLVGATLAYNAGPRAWERLAVQSDAPVLWIQGPSADVDSVEKTFTDNGYAPDHDMAMVAASVSGPSSERLSATLNAPADAAFCTLTEGRAPTGDREGVAESGFAAALGAQIGDETTIWSERSGRPASRATLTIVGLCAPQTATSYPLDAVGQVYVNAELGEQPSQRTIAWSRTMWDPTRMREAMRGVELGQAYPNSRERIRSNVGMLESFSSVVAAAASLAVGLFAIIYLQWAVRGIISGEREYLALLRFNSFDRKRRAAVVLLGIGFFAGPALLVGLVSGTALASRLAEGSLEVYGISSYQVEPGRAGVAFAGALVLLIGSSSLAFLRFNDERAEKALRFRMSWAAARRNAVVLFGWRTIEARRATVTQMMIVLSFVGFSVASTSSLGYLIERYNSDPTAWGILYAYEIPTLDERIEPIRIPPDAIPPDASLLADLHTTVEVRERSRTIALNWAQRPGFRQDELLSGRAPVGPDEVSVTKTLAEDLGVSTGDHITVKVGADERDMNITGIGRGLIDSHAIAVQTDRLPPEWEAEVFDSSVAFRSTVAPEAAMRVLEPYAAGQPLSIRTAAARTSLPFLSALYRGIVLFGILSMGLGVLVVIQAGESIRLLSDRGISALRHIGTGRRFVFSWSAMVGMIVVPLPIVVGYVVGSVALQLFVGNLSELPFSTAVPAVVWAGAGAATLGACLSTFVITAARSRKIVGQTL